MAFHIGELLVRMSHITQKQLDEVMVVQKLEGGRIGDILVKKGMISETAILEALSRQFGIPVIDLENTEIDETILSLIPANTARKYLILPVRKKGNTLTIAITNPAKIFDLKEIKLFTGFNIDPVLASETAVLKAIETYYESTHNVELKRLMDDLGATEGISLEILEEEESETIAKLESDAKQPPVVQIVNHTFTRRPSRKAQAISM